MRSDITRRVRAGAVLLSILVLASCRGGDTGSGAVTLTAQQQRGKALYETTCQTCHGGATGGSLRDIPPPHNANGHTWHHPDRQLSSMVLNGLAFSVEGQEKMPAFKDKLTEDDVKAILAYIKTWWTDEERAWQATVTAQAAQ